MNYKTPGVYVEEIPTFPPSVAQVETAIPAFIGYTENAVDADGDEITEFPSAKRIKSMLEYERFFGKTNAQSMTVEVGTDSLPTKVNVGNVSNYRMYYALQLFYANGGGPCYIISVGKINKTTETIAKADLDNGLAALGKIDEPTIIVSPDAIGLADAAHYYDVLKAAIGQCAKLGDRVTLCDLLEGDSIEDADVTDFRNGIGNNSLKYAAAYHPWLKTSFAHYYENASIVFESDSATMDNKNLGDILALRLARERKETATPIDTAVQALADDPASLDPAKAEGLKVAQAAIEATEAILASPGVAGLPDADAKKIAANDAVKKAEGALGILNADGATLAQLKAASADALESIDDALPQAAVTSGVTNNILKIFTNDFENKLTALLNSQRVTMPPSPAIAGIYAMVDLTRGVWKAPANVSLNAVTAPAVKITDQDQGSLNIHETGKSINAIRAFTGRGIMVWGARTLAGNDNEWRYVNVRRFYNMAEESIKKATEPFVFESNDANTWVRVRAMIENFLTVQWRAGALAGATPSDAFYVRVGLGTTMTSLDILEGRMNVEIGMAVVRPAEFIILKFSHKMAES